MSDEDASEHSSDGQSRRQLIKTTAALGGFSFTTSTARASPANEKADPPNPYPNAGVATADTVYFKHAAGFDATKRALGRYQSTGDASELFSHTLRDRLDENPSQQTVDVVVTTMGERTSMYRDDRRGQRLYGFSPTAAEVRSLAAFGDVTYVADLVSTKVCVRNVAREDLRRLARRPFVVEVSAMSESVEPNSTDSVSTSSTNYVDVSDVLTDSWTAFTSAHGNYTAYTISIGVLGAGYDSSMTTYSSPHAADIGFDRSLSKDFTEESDPFKVTNSLWEEHTTVVADTAGYMLKDGDTHSDQFVSLKIISDDDELVGDDESCRSAIEYATKNGIDVLNMSFGTSSWDKCPSHYCSALDSFRVGGGVAVAAVYNGDNTSAVEYPACSWQTIGVGGVAGKDSSGNAYTKERTEYSSILFYDPLEYKTYCSWCHDASGVSASFSPEVYGVSNIRTETGTKEIGTSYACPQVAASAWIDFADGGIGSYSEAMDRIRNMNTTTVVDKSESKDPAKEGDLLEADKYF